MQLGFFSCNLNFQRKEKEVSFSWILTLLPSLWASHDHASQKNETCDTESHLQDASAEPRPDQLTKHIGDT